MQGPADQENRLSRWQPPARHLLSRCHRASESAEDVVTASPMPRNIKLIHATDFISAAEGDRRGRSWLDGFQVLVDARE
jgi:hypothetical protein